MTEPIKSPYVNNNGKIELEEDKSKSKLKTVCVSGTSLSQTEWYAPISPEDADSVKKVLMSWYEALGSHESYTQEKVNKIKNCPTDGASIRGLIQMLDMKNMTHLIGNLTAFVTEHKERCVNPNCKATEPVGNALQIILDVYATNMQALKELEDKIKKDNNQN